MVPRARLQLGSGRSLVLTTSGGEDGHGYIQTVELNGRPWTSSWLPLADLLRDSIKLLSIKLGPTPHPSWGTGAGDVPPSFGMPRTGE